jgi:ABC-2 type transport system ATP-binding protein
LLGGGPQEPDDGDGEPRGGERAVEFACALASPDDLLEPGGAGVVGVVAAGWVPGEGGAEQEWVSAHDLPADVEELAQRVGGRDGVEPGGVEGGDGFGSHGVKEGVDQAVARREVGVDSLAGDAGRCGDVFHAGVGTLAEHGAGRTDDGVDAALGVGAAATGLLGAIERVSHQGKDTCPAVTLTSRKSSDNFYSMSEKRPAGDSLAIEAHDLVKDYGETRALGGIDLTVPRGQVFGFLGPNGAGKTTTIRILATLARPDGGTARVLGFDVVSEQNAIRARVAVTGQFASLDEDLTGYENLIVFGRLRGLSRAASRHRADELLAAFDLTGAASRLVSGYSGGMRRRLDIGASLIVTPDLLFLDEPTTGMDPLSRTQVWELVRQVAAAGTTVLLTTQYLEEADQLAGQIAVIDHGRIVAEGTSAQLKARVGSRTLHVRLLDGQQRSSAQEVLAGTLEGPVRLGPDPLTLSALLTRPADAADVARLVGHAMTQLWQAGVAVAEVTVGQPSLQEAFLTLTGHPASPAATDPEDTNS